MMGILRHPSPIQIMIDQRQPERVDCFSYLGSVITGDGKCTREINPGLPRPK